MQLGNFQLEWQKLFSTFSSESNSLNKIFWELVVAYSENNRFYHNLLHIQDVLNIASILEPLAENFVAIQMAAWFHDIIYDSKAKDNEEKSAEYAFVSLCNLDIPSSVIDSVFSMIINTKNQAEPNTIDSQILLDADLSILGSDPLKYNAYAQAIRQEYSWVSDAEYRIGRTRVLKRFLQRDRIYFSDKAFQMLEIKARKNMNTEISNFY
ncbi:MAG: hypothetical protein PUP93_34540, partial [Rhizonema sp. NSF051]|nr:hypothetical protein [Rhizonema sp. NSF051]